jgi:hypothetical protein
MYPKRGFFYLIYPSIPPLALAETKQYRGIHKFAHDELHREAWVWFNKMSSTTDFTHISIWHEIFAAPAGSWEAVYANSHPTLLGGARVPLKTESGTEWHSTLVHASSGPLRSSRGRMARTDGNDNASYDADP